MKYNFIEIGTADFETELETCDEESVGLTIEPIKSYLDNLPNKKNVKKINCAVSNCNRKTEIFYVSSENIKKNNLPWFVKGCNSIDMPHPITKGFAFGLNIPDELISKDTIEVKSFEKIIEEYEVEEIDFLKIDTEGHDLVIMNHYIDLCEQNQKLFAKKISFESNILLNQDEVENVLNRLISFGYKVVTKGENSVLEKH